MKVTTDIEIPKVDTAQAQRILKKAKEYHVIKNKMENIIVYALKVKKSSEKNVALRELRMLL